jgi:F0F1-type ATP synthase assembly protein I
VSGGRKLALTAVLFAVALDLVFLTTATRSVIPLFVAWVPLLAVPWVLTRPENG